MPTAAPKPCLQCGVLVRDGTSRCQAHKRREGSFADQRRGSRHERGYGSEWVRTRERILARDCGLCQCDECKRLGRLRLATEVDHRVPKFEGGADDDDNLQAINTECHRAKTAAEAQRGRGAGRKSGGNGRGTDPLAEFSRSGVSAGGVSRAIAGGNG